MLRRRRGAAVTVAAAAAAATLAVVVALSSAAAPARGQGGCGVVAGTPLSQLSPSSNPNLLTPLLGGATYGVLSSSNATAGQGSPQTDLAAVALWAAPRQPTTAVAATTGGNSTTTGGNSTTGTGGATVEEEGVRVRLAVYADGGMGVGPSTRLGEAVVLVAADAHVEGGTGGGGGPQPRRFAAALPSAVSGALAAGVRVHVFVQPEADVLVPWDGGGPSMGGLVNFTTLPFAGGLPPDLSATGIRPEGRPQAGVRLAATAECDTGGAAPPGLTTTGVPTAFGSGSGGGMSSPPPSGGGGMSSPPPSGGGGMSSPPPSGPPPTSSTQSTLLGASTTTTTTTTSTSDTAAPTAGSAGDGVSGSGTEGADETGTLILIILAVALGCVLIACCVAGFIFVTRRSPNKLAPVHDEDADADAAAGTELNHDDDDEDDDEDSDQAEDSFSDLEAPAAAATIAAADKPRRHRGGGGRSGGGGGGERHHHGRRRRHHRSRSPPPRRRRRHHRDGDRRRHGGGRRRGGEKTKERRKASSSSSSSEDSDSHTYDDMARALDKAKGVESPETPADGGGDTPRSLGSGNIALMASSPGEEAAGSAEGSASSFSDLEPPVVREEEEEGGGEDGSGDEFDLSSDRTDSDSGF